MTRREQAERNRLLTTCGLTLFYPEHYVFDPSDDTYTDQDDKHEWHTGADVRRLRQLNEKHQTKRVTNV